MSRYNRWAERQLAADPPLTGEEFRLALTFQRLILGFNRTSERLGVSLLRGESGLHGRSFERARRGLIAKGLINYESGGRGRGRRSLYELVLEEPEKTAQERTYSEPEKTAQKTAQKTAPARSRKEEGGPGSSSLRTYRSVVDLELPGAPALRDGRALLGENQDQELAPLPETPAQDVTSRAAGEEGVARAALPTKPPSLDAVLNDRVLRRAYLGDGAPADGRRPLIGADGYAAFVRLARLRGVMDEDELVSALAAHEFVRSCREVAA